MSFEELESRYEARGRKIAAQERTIQNLRGMNELTAAAEGEGPVAPPAPRLCAVDRLEAAGYYAKPMVGLLLFRHESRPTIDVEYIGTRCARAGIDSPHLRIKGDTVDGLNAALESLLSKPVGAVTVAQILGVAP